MCILIAKPIGVRKPTETELRTSAQNNPDGCGVAWAWKNKINIYHAKKVDEILHLAANIPNDAPAIYHFRIATHGSINLKNCHPFVSDDGEIAFAHNGILSIENDKARDWTDSETAFRYLFLPIQKLYGTQSHEFEAAVQCMIGSSKFAFLESNGTLKTFGTFINEDGLLMSNTSYKPRPIYDDYDFTNCCKSYYKGLWSSGSNKLQGYYEQYTECYSELEAEILDGILCDDENECIKKSELREYAEMFYNDVALVYDLLTKQDVTTMATNILQSYGIIIMNDGNKQKNQRGVAAQV